MQRMSQRNGARLRAFALCLPSLAAIASAQSDLAAVGYGLDGLQPVSAAIAYATLSSGDRVAYDGGTVWIESPAGTVLSVLGSTGAPSFPAFVALDPTGSFALIGESGAGGLFRVPLAGGGPVAVATLPGNYDAVFESQASVLVSAATCGWGCGNGLHRLDLRTGASVQIAALPGPSGPLALSGAGDLYYAVQSDQFPTPPGAISIVRFTATQLSAGPFPLTLAQAGVLRAGLDGGAALRVDPLFGHVFLAQSAFVGPSRVTEIDRFGALVGDVAVSADWIDTLEIRASGGGGALAAFQPAGRQLLLRATDFNAYTARQLTLSPRRPQAQAIPGAGDTLTLRISGAQPSSTCLLVVGPRALHQPQESAHDLGSQLFWTGLPLANIRRTGILIPTDALGTGEITLSNPAPIQGTRVLQVLVRDASGVLRGSSMAAFN